MYMTKLNAELTANIKCETEIKTSMANVDSQIVWPSCLQTVKAQNDHQS